MGIHVYNKGKAPAISGTEINISPGSYGAFSKEIVARLKDTDLPLMYEGEADFEPLWVRNEPDKTPNQIRD